MTGYLRQSVQPAPDVEVTFKGGSLGGEVRRIPVSQVGSGWQIKVPVMSSPAAVAGMATGANPMPASVSYTQETYIIRPGHGGYEAVWQNPHLGLEVSIAGLRSENGRLERMVERMIGLFEDDDERRELLGWLVLEEEAETQGVKSGG